MKNKKLTVTIGVPAYNEELNIQKLLTSILSQKETNFKIAEIILISDRSTDKTVEKAFEVKDKRLNIIRNPKRMGNTQNINKICRMAEGDVVVLFDADVILANKMTLSNLVQPFIIDQNVGLTSGLSWPREASTFIEKAIYVTFKAYIEMRKDIKKGNSIYSCVGRSMALSKEFSKLVDIPKTIYASDAYLYLLCIKNNFNFQFVPSAKIIFNSPATLRDHIKQNTRFVGSLENVYPIFGELAKKEFYVPKLHLYKYLLSEFVKMPMHAAVIFIVNLYTKYLSSRKKGGPLWSTIKSTKGVNIHE